MDGHSKNTAFSFPDGDVILVSSDGLEFQVHKLILSLASPFFRDMFKLPQVESPKPLQSVTMTEDAGTLEALLKIVYPTEAEDVSPEVAISACRAAEKLQFSKVSSMMHYRLQPILETLKNPLEAWAIAVQLNSRQLSKDARIRFIKANTRDCFNPRPKHLNVVPVERYAALINEKEVIIKEARSKLVETLIYGYQGSIGRPACLDPRCRTCGTFAEAYVFLTSNLNPFDPACTSMTILRECFGRALLENRSCQRWKAGAPPDESDREAMQSKLREALSLVT
ncbi:uncharacterized protein EI90DRAFT_2990513 [Cantharellus anzutake]|uniref:uncharacterized protein n=1 Tax=Cantharellus anzutake TaxID=1750568 RepID=UPI0019065561|nr:uncharacterized protein EI90DRAFT_2990513 [Cantharellus anzutake]KAF8339897.1 hypothetical protein EI90DRAFT_2990513 [Cantharellus anzutake]